MLIQFVNLLVQLKHKNNMLIIILNTKSISKSVDSQQQLLFYLPMHDDIDVQVHITVTVTWQAMPFSTECFYISPCCYII